METLKVFEIPLCVARLACGDFENFQSSPVCEDPVLETLKIFAKNPCTGDSLCVGPVLETLKNFAKNPCTGEFP